MAEIAAQPAPTKQELSAEDYFSRAFAREEKDYEGKIADYSEAIRLNPRHVDAYNNRGIVREASATLTAQFADYNQEILLDPQYPIAYANRGAVRIRQGEFDAAYADFDVALRLDRRNIGAIYGIA